MDAIADFIQVAQINGSAAHDARLGRATSTPAKTDWLIRRAVATNILRDILARIPEDGWRHIQHQIGRAVFGSVSNRYSRRICLLR
jgi:hypothetical protein